MVSDWKKLKSKPRVINYVLILVLMEDGLWQAMDAMVEDIIKVLILVLMEDGLWPHDVLVFKGSNFVS